MRAPRFVQLTSTVRRLYALDVNGRVWTRTLSQDDFWELDERAISAEAEALLGSTYYDERPILRSTE
jgi:hypothetical protein